MLFPENHCPSGNVRTALGSEFVIDCGRDSGVNPEVSATEVASEMCSKTNLINKLWLSLILLLITGEETVHANIPVDDGEFLRRVPSGKNPFVTAVAFAGPEG